MLHSKGIGGQEECVGGDLLVGEGSEGGKDGGSLLHKKESKEKRKKAAGREREGRLTSVQSRTKARVVLITSEKTSHGTV